jgi:UDP-glucose 4-epimerase
MHAPETHLIPLAMEAARGGPELQVYGNDYPTPDGTCVRDYIHVNDLAEAHVRAVGYLKEGGTSIAVNLGTGQGYSVLEVVRAIETLTGQEVRRKTVPRRPGDTAVLVADPRRAEKVLQWKARRSLLETVGTAWKWMRRRDVSHKAA